MMSRCFPFDRSHHLQMYICSRMKVYLLIFMDHIGCNPPPSFFFYTQEEEEEEKKGDLLHRNVCVCGGVVSSIDFGEQMEDDNIFEEAFKSFPSPSLYLYPPLKKENIRSRCMCLHRKKKKKIGETDEGYHFLFWTISPAVCVCIVGTVFPSSRLVELCTRILHSQLLLLLLFFM